MSNCKNCNTQLLSKNDFCPSCGGKVIRNRLTLKALFSNFSEQFLNYDNKFLKTFLHLFSKPEEVIDGYINGTRKKYVNVVSYFAIAITLSGLLMFVLNKFFPGLLDFSSIENKNQVESINSIMDFTTEYQGLIMMFSVPLYALLSKITFFNFKKYNYTEHLVIFMFVSAQLSIIGILFILFTALTGISIMSIGVLIYPISIIYSAYCLKRLYKLSVGKIILKSFLFLFVLFALYIVFSIAFVASYYLIDPEGLLEFGKSFAPPKK